MTQRRDSTSYCTLSILYVCCYETWFVHTIVDVCSASSRNALDLAFVAEPFRAQASEAEASKHAGRKRVDTYPRGIFG